VSEPEIIHRAGDATKAPQRVGRVRAFTPVFDGSVP
jgi:hypothetical protein